MIGVGGRWNRICERPRRANCSVGVRARGWGPLGRDGGVPGVAARGARDTLRTMWGTLSARPIKTDSSAAFIPLRAGQRANAGGPPWPWSPARCGSRGVSGSEWWALRCRNGCKRADLITGRIHEEARAPQTPGVATQRRSGQPRLRRTNSGSPGVCRSGVTAVRSTGNCCETCKKACCGKRPIGVCWNRGVVACEDQLRTTSWTSVPTKRSVSSAASLTARTSRHASIVSDSEAMVAL